jgi:hypothetical protein
VADTAVTLSAQDRTKAAFDSIGERLRGLEAAGSRLNGLTGSLPLIGTALSAIGVVSLTGTVKSIIDVADGLNDMSQRTGIAVKSLAGYKLAAEQSGASLGAVAMGVKGLSAVMREHGDELGKLGIDTKDADKAFRQLADVIAIMPDGMEKAALMVKLFGRSGMELIPLMNMGSKGLDEAAEKSLKYAEAMAVLAPQADQVNDRLAELSVAGAALGANLVVSLAPSLTKITEAMALAAQEGGLLHAVFVGLGGVMHETFKPKEYSLDELNAQLAQTLLTIGKLRTDGREDQGALGNLINRLTGNGTVEETLKGLEQRFAELKAARDALLAPAAGKTNPADDFTKKQLADLEKLRKAIAAIFADGKDSKKPGSEIDEATKQSGEAYVAFFKQLAAAEEEAAFAGMEMSKAQKAFFDLQETPLWAAASEEMRAWIATQYAATRAQEQATAATKAAAEWQKALEDARIKSTAAAADTAEDLLKQAKAAEEENAAIGKTSEQLAILAARRYDEQIALKEAEVARLRGVEGREGEVYAIEQQIGALRRLKGAEVARPALQEQARAWENFSRDLESSLTDALMRSFEAGDSFGEAFKDNLENLFKTMILKAAVQVTVSTLAGGVEQALGLNGGGSGGSGSLGSLLSTGSSLYNAATGGGIFGSIGGFGAGAASAASELALGASFVGPSASLAGGAVGAGATAGLSAGASGASALSGLAAAAPWVAGGLAIASIFGGDLFGKNKPAPIEWGLVDLPRGPNPQQYYGSMPYLAPWASHMEHGPFGTLLTTGQHLSRNGMSAAALQSQVTSPLIQLDNVLAGYLSEKEKNKISMALYNGREGEHGWSQGEVEGVMMRRLDRISNAIGGWVDKLADSTTGNLQQRYTQLAQILSIRGDEFFEKLAKDMFRAYGSAFDFKKFSALSDGVMQFKSLFYSEQEKFDEASATVKKALADLNLTLPESRDGFRDLVEGIDTGTQSGFKMYESLIALAPAMDGYYAALQSELDVKRQLTAMNEDHFSTVEDFTRYQRVSQNYDAAFAGDYAYNIQRGAIQPGGARYGDMVAELRALRTENQAQAVALATAQQETARILRRWNGDGMPAERVVA